MRLELIRHFCQQFLRLSCLPIPALSHIARLSEPPIGTTEPKPDIIVFMPVLLQLRYLAKISPTSGNCGKLTALRCPIAVCSLLLYLIQRFIILCKTFVQSHLVANHCIKEQYISALRIMKPFYCKVLVGGSYRYCPDVDGLKVHCNTFILMTHIPTLDKSVLFYFGCL